MFHDINDIIELATTSRHVPYFSDFNCTLASPALALWLVRGLALNKYCCGKTTQLVHWPMYMHVSQAFSTYCVPIV